MPAKTAIFVALAGFAVWFSTVFASSVRREGTPRPTWGHLATGLVTNFFDTLGIGSFATTTAIFKFLRMVPDEVIPGTLNVGHTLPVIVQAFIYIAAIEVDAATLVLLVGSATLGGWLGAGLVAGLPRRAVQKCMGGALLVAAVALLARLLGWFPVGGEALELRGGALASGVIGNFLFGAISTLGIGFYAPCMTMVSLLGMNPAAAFPIMMGSSAFLMPAASVRFVWKRAYAVPVALGLTLGGIVGVPIAAFLVGSMPLTALRWLVLGVVLYAAFLMLRESHKTETNL